jgi:hypothetical protein
MSPYNVGRNVTTGKMSSHKPNKNQQKKNSGETVTTPVLGMMAGHPRITEEAKEQKEPRAKETNTIKDQWKRWMTPVLEITKETLKSLKPKSPSSKSQEPKSQEANKTIGDESEKEGQIADETNLMAIYITIY